MLKVAVIIERADVGLGGAERSVAELTAELRRQGAAATILAAKGMPADDVTVLCGDYPGRRVPLQVFEGALRTYLAEHSFDIVHSTLPLTIADVYQPRGGSYREAMLQNSASYAGACRRFLKRHTHWLNAKRTQYLNAEKAVCRDPSIHIAALSNYVKRQFQRHYALPQERITVVPNGIDTRLEPDPAQADAIRKAVLESIPIPAGKQPVLFLFAAHNPRLKGIEPLLSAFGRVSGQTPEGVYPMLVVAGSKDVRTPAANVVYLGPLEVICHALAVCDAAVLPTWYDPCSRFILEALAMGKPAITTRFNGAAERFTDGRHGVILERPDHIEGLTEALRTFCDPEKIALAHKAIVDDNLRDDVSIEKHVSALLALYTTIMNKDRT